MRNNGRTSQVGWLPLKGSYEEAVLDWYEQIETSFRRRRLELRRAETEPVAPREVVVDAGQVVFD